MTCIRFRSVVFVATTVFCVAIGVGGCDGTLQTDDDSGVNDGGIDAPADQAIDDRGSEDAAADGLVDQVMQDRGIDQAPADQRSPDTMPPDVLPPDTLPPDTLPPDTRPPDQSVDSMPPDAGVADQSVDSQVLVPLLGRVLGIAGNPIDATVSVLNGPSTNTNPANGTWSLNVLPDQIHEIRVVPAAASLFRAGRVIDVGTTGVPNVDFIVGTEAELEAFVGGNVDVDPTTAVIAIAVTGIGDPPQEAAVLNPLGGEPWTTISTDGGNQWVMAPGGAFQPTGPNVIEYFNVPVGSYQVSVTSGAGKTCAASPSGYAWTLQAATIYFIFGACN